LPSLPSLSYKLTINYDPIFNKYIDNDEYISIKTKGGLLSDEMGLGKTVTSIALITENPRNEINNKYIEINNIKKIESKATLIICPSHISNQWKKEIIKCNSSLKVMVILSRIDYWKYSFEDYINSDIIISSFQFLTNYDFYLSLHYLQLNKSSYDFNRRMTQLNNFSKDNFTDNCDISKLHKPLFEFFSRLHAWCWSGEL
jgi:SNF2 family DNA or RNA helicase